MRARDWANGTPSAVQRLVSVSMRSPLPSQWILGVGGQNHSCALQLFGKVPKWRTRRTFGDDWELSVKSLYVFLLKVLLCSLLFAWCFPYCFQFRFDPPLRHPWRGTWCAWTSRWIVQLLGRLSTTVAHCSTATSPWRSICSNRRMLRANSSGVVPRRHLRSCASRSHKMAWVVARGGSRQNSKSNACQHCWRPKGSSKS